MTVRHHIRDELLLDYASGNLAEGWSIAVASHLALCPACRVRLARMEAAAGALMEASTAVEEREPVSDQSWASMRARIKAERAQGDVMEMTRPPETTRDTPRRSPPAAAAAAKPNADAAPVIPEPLRSYLGSDLSGLKWKPLGLGAYHIPIHTGDGETSVRLLRIPAGKPVPEHSHGGRELTLVLNGSFHDGVDRFARGDLEDADEDLEHQPVADAGEDCICLAVTDAPLRFKSRLLRFMQPVLKI